MPTSHLDDTAKEILNAASRRFLHYGYKKTTMSEIAQDCNMSTGNLYRYFSSKLDIVEVIIAILRSDLLKHLRTIANEPDKTPAEKIRNLFLYRFRFSYERFHNNPKAFELSNVLIEERPHLAIDWQKNERLIIAEILEMGNQDRSFDVQDTDAIAKVLQDSVYRFTTPAIFYEGEFDDLSNEFDGVINFLLDGLKPREPAPPSIN